MLVLAVCGQLYVLSLLIFRASALSWSIFISSGDLRLAQPLLLSVKLWTVKPLHNAGSKILHAYSLFVFLGNLISCVEL